MEVVDDINPPILTALLAAINYVFAAWNPDETSEDPEPRSSAALGGVEQVLALWARRLSSLITMPASLARDVRELKGSPEPIPFGAELWLLRRSLLENPQADPKTRNKLSEKLEQYWLKIGRAAGIVPKRQGDLNCTLGDRLLRDLLDEGARLVREITAFTPSPEDLALIRLLIGHDVIDAGQQHLLEAFQVRHPQLVESKREGMIESFDEKYAVSLFILFLQFPMLYTYEVTYLLSSWKQGQRRRTRHRTLALDLLERRLPIGRSQINKRIHRSRK